MRKKDPRYKKYQLRRATKKAEHELKRKKHRWKEKLVDFPTRKRVKKYGDFINNPDKAKHDTHIAPENLSLIEDPTSVINYIDAAHKSLASGIPVEFDLSKIKHITPETLMLLCALFNDREFTSDTPISGNIPVDENLRKIFINVGFYNFVKPRMNPPKRVYDSYGEIINRISKTRVDPDTAVRIVQTALGHSLGITDIKVIKRHVIYPILIECMSNTKEHSNYGKKQVTYNWWVFAYKEIETKITKICFLDLGVGIFGSLRKKYTDNKLTNDLLNAVFPGDNVRTIRKIFEGELKHTSTEKSERGLGLNDIHDKASTGEHMKNFILISNNVFARIGEEDDRIVKLTENFMGTLYYFEISPE